MTQSSVTASAFSASQSLPEGVDPKIALERALIERVVNGERELFYELIRPYERSVFMSALAIVSNEADAEEVAQEAFLKALKNLAHFRQESKFSTWLIQIAINEARMKLRKDHRKLYESIDEGQRNDDGDYVPLDFADWREIPSQALERSELRDALSNALKKLHEKYRSVLVLRDVQQLSIAETARALGITEENVKTRTSRARLQMRDLLSRTWAQIQSARLQNEETTESVKGNSISQRAATSRASAG
jgi:RNA polymerase sigma-70 factor (ECF subfamily)